MTAGALAGTARRIAKRTAATITPQGLRCPNLATPADPARRHEKPSPKVKICNENGESDREGP